MPSQNTVVRTTLRALVVKLDPNWVRDSKRIVEYRFSNGRTFEANYQQRGAYSES